MYTRKEVRTRASKRQLLRTVKERVLQHQRTRETTDRHHNVQETMTVFDDWREHETLEVRMFNTVEGSPETQSILSLVMEFVRVFSTYSLRVR